MKLGLSTKVLRDYSMKDSISIAARYGYEALEIWVDDLKSSEISVGEIIRMTDEYQMERSIHLCTEDLNIASFNEGIRKESLHQQKEGLKWAAEAGARCATLHPGRKTAKTRTMEEAWKVQIESIKELAETANACGVCLCVEAMEVITGEFILTPEDLKKTIEKCNVPGMAVTLDLAHLQTVGDTCDLLKRSKNLPVGNVHISQSANGKPHLTVYDDAGEISFSDALAVLRTFYDDAMIIEGYLPGKGMEIAEKSMKWYKGLKY